jgi:hypothetical protein
MYAETGVFNIKVGGVDTSGIDVTIALDKAKST